MYSFTATDPDTRINSDGAGPNGLIVSVNTLYGTAETGGSSGVGTVFKVNTDGTGFTNLHSFTTYSGCPSCINSDGAYLWAGLILSGDTLYGTASRGGSRDNGTVFKVNIDGTGFTALHSFTGSDGIEPNAGLILSGNILYGTVVGGGRSGEGTVFAVNTDGTGFTTLYSFTAIPKYPPYINSDGAFPHAGLILSGNTLYGTAQGGGSSGYGTVFAVNTDGTGFTNLYTFTATIPGYTNSYGSVIYTNRDGASPEAGLILSGNTLYGTAGSGGSSGNGTVFSLTLPVAAPQLTIVASASNVILTWPTNAVSFTLQSTTNLVSPAVWTTVSPGPVVIDGQNTVTNSISGTQTFYRLSQ